MANLFSIAAPSNSDTFTDRESRNHQLPKRAGADSTTVAQGPQGEPYRTG